MRFYYVHDKKGGGKKRRNQASILPSRLRRRSCGSPLWVEFIDGRTRPMSLSPSSRRRRQTGRSTCVEKKKKKKKRDAGDIVHSFSQSFFCQFFIVRYRLATLLLSS